MSLTSTEKLFPASSNVRRIKFIEPSTLEVEYTGGTYRYKGVPRQVYDHAIEALSIGEFLNQNVKKHYEYSKV